MERKAKEVGVEGDYVCPDCATLYEICGLGERCPICNRPELEILKRQDPRLGKKSLWHWALCCPHCEAEWIADGRYRGLRPRRFNVHLSLVKPASDGRGSFAMVYEGSKPAGWWFSNYFQTDLAIEKQAYEVPFVITCNKFRKNIPLTTGEKWEEWIGAKRIAKTERPIFQKNVSLQRGVFRQVVQVRCPACSQSLEMQIIEPKLVRVTTKEVLSRLSLYLAGGLVGGVILGVWLAMAIPLYFQQSIPPIQLYPISILLGLVAALGLALNHRAFSRTHAVTTPGDRHADDPPIVLPPERQGPACMSTFSAYLTKDGAPPNNHDIYHLENQKIVKSGSVYTYPIMRERRSQVSEQ